MADDAQSPDASLGSPPVAALEAIGIPRQEAERLARDQSERTAAATERLIGLDEELAEVAPPAPAAPADPERCRWPAGCGNPRPPSGGGRRPLYCGAVVDEEDAQWEHSADGAREWRRRHGEDAHRVEVLQPLVDLGALSSTDLPDPAELELPTAVLERELTVALSAAERASVTAVGASLVSADLLRAFPERYIDAAKRAVTRVALESQRELAARQLAVLEAEERVRLTAGALAAATADLAGVRADLDVRQEALDEAAQAIESLQHEAVESAGRLANLEADRARLETDVAETSARAEVAEERSVAVSEDLAQARARVEEQAETIAAERQRVIAAQEERDSRVADAQKAAATAVAAAEADRDQARSRAEQAEGEATRLQQSLAQTQASTAQAEARAEAAEERNVALSEDLAQARARIEEQAETIAAERQRVISAQEERDARVAAVQKAAATAVAAAEADRDQARSRAEQADARAGKIEELSALIGRLLPGDDDGERPVRGGSNP